MWNSKGYEVKHSWRILREFTHDRSIYEGWNFNSGNYLFTTATK